MRTLHTVSWIKCKIGSIVESSNNKRELVKKKKILKSIFDTVWFSIDFLYKTGFKLKNEAKDIQMVDWNFFNAAKENKCPKMNKYQKEVLT